MPAALLLLLLLLTLPNNALGDGEVYDNIANYNYYKLPVPPVTQYYCPEPVHHGSFSSQIAVSSHAAFIP